MPEVHLVVNENYMNARVNPEKFLQDRVKVDKILADINENPLVDIPIKKPDAGLVDEAITLLDVIDPTIREGGELKTVTTKEGYLSFVHNLSEIDVIANEEVISRDVNRLEVVRTINDFVSSVADIFISRTEDTDRNSELRRLLKPAAQRYFSMLLQWRVDRKPFSLVVKNIIDYWDETGGYIYSRRWGDHKFEGEWTPRWIDWESKSPSQKVNIAIVKVKDDYDFIESALSKYVELFQSLEVIDADLYLDLKYGTRDEKQIDLIRSGVNAVLAKRLLDQYSEYVSFDAAGTGKIIFNPKILEEMRRTSENPIEIFEVQMMAGL